MLKQIIQLGLVIVLRCDRDVFIGCDLAFTTIGQFVFVLCIVVLTLSFKIACVIKDFRVWVDFSAYTL
ncbi:MAG: hypothetical protein IPP42_01250 [Saprospiraceae bacterium]|nr:hypothetical protein [Saprospiraceae bacterium]